MPGRRILVVDDEQSVLEFIETVLEDEGFSVTTAKTAAKARTLLKQQQFDLAIVDIYLEDESGLELARLVKENTPSTAVVVITGYPSTDNIKASLEREVDGYLIKPVDLEALKNLVGKLTTKER